MKNTHLIINIVLGIFVAYLLYSNNQLNEKIDELKNNVINANSETVKYNNKQTDWINELFKKYEDLEGRTSDLESESHTHYW